MSVKNEEFLKFVEQYTKLISDQVECVYEDMEEAVDSVMQCLNQLSSSSEGSVKKAKAVSRESNISSAIDGDELVEQEKKLIEELAGGSYQVNSEIVQAGKSLRSVMSGLDSIDDRVQQSVFSIMGKVSVTDVLRQQLEHISQTCVEINKLVDECYAEEHLSVSVVREKIECALENIYQTYTMESEKEQFHKFF